MCSHQNILRKIFSNLSSQLHQNILSGNLVASSVYLASMPTTASTSTGTATDFIINFEPNSVLRFENSNEQGQSLRTKLKENKYLSNPIPMSKHWEKRGSESESEAEYSTKTSKKTHSNRKGNDYNKYD